MKEFDEKDDNIENNLNNKDTEESKKKKNNTNQENFNNDKQYKKIKMSFLKKIKISIFDFDKYYMIASESISKSLIFLFQIFTLFAIIVAFSFTYKIAQGGKNICDEIIKKMPEFSLTNDELICDIEEPVVIENTDNFVKVKVIFDNSEDSNVYMEQFKEYNGYAVAFNKYNVTIKYSEDKIETYKYKDIQVGLNVNKENVVQILQNNRIYTLIFIYISIILFIIYFVSMLLDILALAVLGLIITKLVRLPLRFYSVFAIAVASTTLPIVLNLLYLVANIFLNFTMPQFQVMITLVSYIYLIAGILILRSNLKKGTTSLSEKLNKEVNEEKGT